MRRGGEAVSRRSGEVELVRGRVSDACAVEQQSGAAERLAEAVWEEREAVAEAPASSTLARLSALRTRRSIARPELGSSRSLARSLSLSLHSSSRRSPAAHRAAETARRTQVQLAHSAAGRAQTSPLALARRPARASCLLSPERSLRTDASF